MTHSPPHVVWRAIQRQNIRSFDALTSKLGLETDQLAHLDIDPSFPINIPLRLVSLMERGNPADPIFLQFVPLRLEREGGGSPDPVGDLAARRTGRLLHKYEGRALLTTTSVCAMHCRYCFRKEFPYQPGGDYREELELIRADTSIHEVILSGGDPLSLSDRTLGTLLGLLGAIPHVKLIRFHTRFPIGIPERIDANFLRILEQSEKQIWFVIHANHPREITADLGAALKQVQRLGIPILNQSVLLKGVNDKVSTHAALLERLISFGIQPYYLHQLDPVTGSDHFAVSESTGLALIEYLRAKLPGYAIPTYVRELAGGVSKEPVTDGASSPRM